MSQIIGDALVGGGIVGDVGLGTSEAVVCQAWSLPYDRCGGEEWWRECNKRSRAIGCKMSGRLRPTHARCEASRG